jgi:hypothetical protein
MTATTTTAAMPMHCGPFLQVLLVKAAEALEMALIPEWDETGRRELFYLRKGTVQPYWVSNRRRHLSRTDLMARSALLNYVAVTDDREQASAARLLADEIRLGTVAIW